MPPDGKLPDDKIAAIERWIELGAPWPEPSEEPAPGSKHPRTGRSNRSGGHSRRVSRDPLGRANPIDRFILARLEAAGLKPSAEASATTLVRRVHLDLTGLPPAPDVVRDFVEDTAPGAYERVVERLLDSPAYGERWGRHWLDVARYADSNGYNADAQREIWMYRDWVIDALNRDLPFEQFAIEQLAGDLLPDPSEQSIVATGFHRNTLLNLEGGVDFEQYRVESVVDRVDVTGIAFLGLSLGCARCHDHKYDPISQREFYEFFAFFNNIDELSGAFKNNEGRARAYEPVLEFGSDEQYLRQKAIKAQIEAMQAGTIRLPENTPPQAARMGSEPDRGPDRQAPARCPAHPAQGAPGGPLGGPPSVRAQRIPGTGPRNAGAPQGDCRPSGLCCRRSRALW